LIEDNEHSDDYWKRLRDRDGGSHGDDGCDRGARR